MGVADFVETCAILTLLHYPYDEGSEADLLENAWAILGPAWSSPLRQLFNFLGLYVLPVPLHRLSVAGADRPIIWPILSDFIGTR